MPLNIKNSEAHGLAKELADLTGESITKAVTQALRDALIKARMRHRDSTQRLVSELDEITAHCAALPVLDSRSPEEILGYDERGLPA